MSSDSNIPPKSRNCCCVPQCSTYYGGDVSFHKFPFRDEKLKKEWIRIFKIEKKVTKFMAVCSKHFKNEDYFFNKAFVNKRPRLRRDAVPSQNLPKSYHQKKVNEKLVLASSSRCSKREQLRETLLSENKDDLDLESINQDQLIEKSTHDDNTIEAAEALLSFKHTMVQTVKISEDKGVQVNVEELKRDIVSLNWKQNRKKYTQFKRHVHPTFVTS